MIPQHTIDALYGAVQKDDIKALQEIIENQSSADFAALERDNVIDSLYLVSTKLHKRQCQSFLERYLTINPIIAISSTNNQPEAIRALFVGQEEAGDDAIKAIIDAILAYLANIKEDFLPKLRRHCISAIPASGWHYLFRQLPHVEKYRYLVDVDNVFSIVTRATYEVIDSRALVTAFEQLDDDEVTLDVALFTFAILAKDITEDASFKTAMLKIVECAMRISPDYSKTKSAENTSRKINPTADAFIKLMDRVVTFSSINAPNLLELLCDIMPIIGNQTDFQEMDFNSLTESLARSVIRHGNPDIDSAGAFALYLQYLTQREYLSCHAGIIKVYVHAVSVLFEYRSNYDIRNWINNIIEVMSGLDITLQKSLISKINTVVYSTYEVETDNATQSLSPFFDLMEYQTSLDVEFIKTYSDGDMLISAAKQLALPVTTLFDVKKHIHPLTITRLAQKMPFSELLNYAKAHKSASADIMKRMGEQL